MNFISKFKDFFKKKEDPKPEPKTKKDFNIDEFNEWFKTEFEGYDGRKGAPGIFLRLDKFSTNWVEQYLEHIGQDTSYEEVQKYYDIIRKDWRSRL